MEFRRFIPVLVAILGVALTGCLESPYPLDASPQESVDPGLLGSWQGESDENGSENIQLDIFAFNEAEYVVRQIETDEDGEREESLLRGFLSDVEGDTFVNVQCVSCDDDDREFIFVKLDAQSDRLVLTPFTGESNTNVTFQTVADIRNYVTKHRRDAEFFDDALTFRRIPAKE